MSVQDQRRRFAMRLIVDKLLFSLVKLVRGRARRLGKFPNIIVPIDDEIGIRVIATGMFEATQLDAVEVLLESAGQQIGFSIDPKGVFIDVGANIGLYTLRFSRYFARTIAFEANPLTFRVLDANIALSDMPSVACVCRGLSDHSCTATLHVPPGGNLGWATLNGETWGEGDLFSGYGAVSARQVSVELRTLDGMLDELELADAKISLIKVDVEGHEQQVFTGATNLLRRQSPVVLFEALDHHAASACARLLRDVGYVEFYRFRRGLPSKDRRLGGILRDVFQGLAVQVEKVDPDALNRSPLICAVKPAP